MKNKPQTGHSTRRGNSVSPYQKYQKTPYKYPPGYYAWFRAQRKRNGRALAGDHRTDNER